VLVMTIAFVLIMISLVLLSILLHSVFYEISYGKERKKFFIGGLAVFCLLATFLILLVMEV